MGPDTAIQIALREQNARETAAKLFARFTKEYKTEGVAAQVMLTLAENIEGLAQAISEGRVSQESVATLVAAMRSHATGIIARGMFRMPPPEGTDTPKGG